MSNKYYWDTVETIMNKEDVYGTIVPLEAHGVTPFTEYAATDNMSTDDRCVYIALSIEEAYKHLWSRMQKYYNMLTEDNGLAEQIIKLFYDLESMLRSVSAKTAEPQLYERNVLDYAELDTYSGFRCVHRQLGERAEEVMDNMQRRFSIFELQEYATLWRSFQLTHHSSEIEWLIHLRDVINAHLDKNGEEWLAH